MEDRYKDRQLTDPTKKNDFNTWYNIQIPETKLKDAEKKLEADLKAQNRAEYIDSQVSWQKFYENHQNNFFKDRKWLLLEFPFLENPDLEILELGCGTGNSLKYLPQEKIHACDFSAKALEIAKNKFSAINFFQHDITQEYTLRSDCAIMIFVLSAVHPKFHKQIFKNIFENLYSGGYVCFKDYGKYDMVQLRFKETHVVDENFYKRSDGTYAYFFDIKRLKDLLALIGFKIESLFEDKKLHVNRKRGLDMYRVMIQGVFRKI